MEIQEKKWYQKWWVVLLIFILALILSGMIAFGVYVIKLAKVINEQGQSSGSMTRDSLETTNKRAIAESEVNYWLGNNDAKIVIVEFSDYNCPFCAQSSPIIRSVVKKHSNDVKLIYRDLPLHDESKKLAIAARCAGEQKKFWQMHDKLFERVGPSSDDDLIDFGRSIGINANSPSLLARAYNN